MAVKIILLAPEDLALSLFVIIFLWISSFLFSFVINKQLISALMFKQEQNAARAQAEAADKQKSQFIAAASHDIRQPLQALFFFIDALKHKNKQVELISMLTHMESSALSMSDLLNSLLDISKLDAKQVIPNPQHTYLTPIFEQLAKEFLPLAEKQKIHFRFDANSLISYIDRTLLKQVLSNFLNNAFRYTYKGEIILSATQEVDTIKISVSDTGIGIESDKKEIIFQEFYQVANPCGDRKKGIGLGLSIVKKLCKLQSWPLQVESTLGEGSVFSIKLPLGNAKLTRETDISKPFSLIKGLKLLIIDDSKEILTGISFWLEKWGCEFVSVHSEAEAIGELHRLQFIPDIILSDYNLEDDMNGIRAVKNIRTILGNIVPAVILTGDTSADRISLINSSGLVYLSKPIVPLKLIATLNKLIITAKLSGTD
ncbi:hybrid sensor histidine kinase/response regulator [Pseudoalteromonas sp. SG44-8]|uniref:ATP-binding response regulator n=1 Tax=Pseudoalteromonas sp. SG44-8 TaxID=2760958 RepID=UPI0015FF4D37|nr:hybrid sensor histidine kinase/response regulator [Pseudoalteromonas sp. SG44-8]MBB1396700.1 hybrid sensor histidine kinase/response regulator [Pseudoalteromonas sp. SG44-8]